MITRYSLLLTCALILAWYAAPVKAQYILPYDTMKTKTDSTVEDSTDETDTVNAGDIEEEHVGDTTVVRHKVGDTPQDSQAAQLKMANDWVRRLLFRGWLDTSHIGAFARYQLTSWGQTIGSYGPIEARVTVYYLGSTDWQGKDAEWLQVAVQTMEDEPTLIEYDLIVPSKQKIDEVYRVLYRIDRGDVHPGSLALPDNIVDYDRTDKPSEEGIQNLEFYSGIYQTQVFHGAGTNGADVYIYRADKMPPLGIVVLGYGDEGLMFSSAGNDAAPRFYVPPPPPAAELPHH